MNPEEFYRLRDDRTNRIIGELDYHKLHVRLVAGPETVHTLGGQVQLLLAANMLSRWCRHVEFGFPDAPLAPALRKNGHVNLYNQIRTETNGADPYGDFKFCKTSSPKVAYTLKAGGCFLPNENVDFTIDAHGWRASAGLGHQSFDIGEDQTNLSSATFAACMGVADAFKVAVGLPSHYRVQKTTISLLNFGTNKQFPMGGEYVVPETIDLGNTQIVGIGSVGSAVVYLLSMLPLRGNILLIDYDPIDYVNLNRSPLFGYSDVGRPKVNVAKEHLGKQISVDAFIGSYADFIELHGRSIGSVDLLLPLANEHGVRASIENNYPPLQVYGTTTTDWGINYHRHIPLREDCSTCRFPLDEIKVPTVCSETQLQMERGVQIDAALPFASVAAAALIVADLQKLQLREYPFTPNFAFIDFKGPMEFLSAHDKPQRARCICDNRSKNLHTRWIRATRFSQHSSMGTVVSEHFTNPA